MIAVVDPNVLSLAARILEAFCDCMIVGIEELVPECFWREIANVEAITIAHGIKPLAPLVIALLDPVVSDVIMDVALIVLGKIQWVELPAGRGLLQHDGILFIERSLIGEAVVGYLSCGACRK